MTHIYAALTLPPAGKEVNEENMTGILEGAGMQVDESEIEAVITLVEALETKSPAPIPRNSAKPPEEHRIHEKTLGTQSSNESSTGRPAAPSVSVVGDEALYLYCLGDGAAEATFGNIGIEGNVVYTIPHREISAVVHKCPPQPYQSEDEGKVKEWVMAHQSVVDTAWERFGTVLPVGFDTIIRSTGAVNAEGNFRLWVEENYEKLKGNLTRVRERVEVGVQILWDGKVIARNIVETNERIKKLNEEMNEKSPGMAYFHRQKIERALRNELEQKADEYFRDLYGRIKMYADDIRIEKTKRTEGDKQMIMNLSVLIQKDKIRTLGEELAKIKQKEGMDVRFTGPWPPYSFVTQA